MYIYETFFYDVKKNRKKYALKYASIGRGIYKKGVLNTGARIIQNFEFIKDSQFIISMCFNVCKSFFYSKQVFALRAH